MIFSYLLRRLNLLVVTVLVLALLSYVLAFLFPGEAITNLSGVPTNDPTVYKMLVQKYALDENYLVQFGNYLRLLANGEWGFSINSGESVLFEIKHFLPATLELTFYALGLTLLVGVPLGIWSGLRFHRGVDHSILASSVVGYSVPPFWLAMILIIVFSLQLGWLPLSGRISLLIDIPHQTGFIIPDILLSDIPDKFSAIYNAGLHLVMPVLSISVITTAVIIRVTRRSMYDVAQSDYMQAAIARGLSPYQAVKQHGLRNALLPILPQIVTQLIILLTNAMIVEVIFSWPGIGNWLIQAISSRDYPAIRGGMLAVSAIVIFFTLAMDVLVRAINPLKRRDIHGTV